MIECQVIIRCVKVIIKNGGIGILYVGIIV